MLALKLFTVVFERSDRSISFERVDVTAIRVVQNTLSLSAEASLCRRPRLGRRENESAGGGGDTVLLPIVHWLELILAKFLYKVLLYDNNQTGEILN